MWTGLTNGNAAHVSADQHGVGLAAHSHLAVDARPVERLTLQTAIRGATPSHGPLLGLGIGGGGHNGTAWWTAKYTFWSLPARNRALHLAVFPAVPLPQALLAFSFVMDAGVNSEYQCQHMHFCCSSGCICFASIATNRVSWRLLCSRRSCLTTVSILAQCGVHCSYWFDGRAWNHHALVKVGGRRLGAHGSGTWGALSRAVKPIERGPFVRLTTCAFFGRVHPMFCEFCAMCRRWSTPLPREDFFFKVKHSCCRQGMSRCEDSKASSYNFQISVLTLLTLLDEVWGLSFFSGDGA